MIKKLLIALDPDSDTITATRYAIDIAKSHNAEVTGLAVVDMGSIEASSRGGGIGSFYLMEKVQQNLTEEARTTARQVTGVFQEAMNATGVAHQVHQTEGVPYQRIIEDMKYHDLLLVGKEPHFFYSHPDQKTRTLIHIVRDTVAPTLIIPEEYRPVKRVLIAYDGSYAAARTLHQFIQLKPFGTDLQLEILNIHEKGKPEAVEWALHMAKAFCEAHGFAAQYTAIQGTDPAKQIMDFARQTEADAIVAGAHTVSSLTKLAFGSTTSTLLNECQLPLFLDH